VEDHPDEKVLPLRWHAASISSGLDAARLALLAQPSPVAHPPPGFVTVTAGAYPNAWSMHHNSGFRPTTRSSAGVHALLHRPACSRSGSARARCFGLVERACGMHVRLHLCWPVQRWRPSARRTRSTGPGVTRLPVHRALGREPSWHQQGFPGCASSANRCLVIRAQPSPPDQRSRCRAVWEAIRRRRSLTSSAHQLLHHRELLVSLNVQYALAPPTAESDC